MILEGPTSFIEYLMLKRDFILLYIIGLVPLLLTASFQASPGYMDADYYYVTGREMARGEGLTENFLWNYLDDPAGVRHPAFAYWMPATAFVAAAGMAICRTFTFQAARVLFILLAAGLSPMTAALAQILSGRRQAGWLAGSFAALPGFYLPYLTTTDSFGIYMLAGGAWFLLIARAKRQGATWPLFALGLVSGMMFLIRVDGLLWAGLSMVFVLFYRTRVFRVASVGSSKSLHWLRDQRLYVDIGLSLLGFLLVVGPWLLRNQMLYGLPFSPAGQRALWVIDYDELYAYPPTILTFGRWAAQGWERWLSIRWTASTQNLQTLAFVQGEIFLFPLAIWGAWKMRIDNIVRLGLLGVLTTFGLMSVVFPSQGWRGGFFHAGAAYQTLVWALAALGLEGFVSWGGQVRGWRKDQGRVILGAGLVCIAGLLSGMVVQKRVLASPWDAPARQYAQLERGLDRLGISKADFILVNNPPGYYGVNNRPAIVVPYGGLESVMHAARRYGVEVFLLEPNHPQALDELYRSPGDGDGYEYIGQVASTRIFRLNRP